MKKKVSPQSIAALAFAVKTTANAKQRILDFIGTRPGCSREEITAGTGIKLRSVTGNVTHLIDKQAVVEDGTKLNETGRKVGRLWIPGKVAQCSQINETNEDKVLENHKESQ